MKEFILFLSVWFSLIIILIISALILPLKIQIFILYSLGVYGLLELSVNIAQIIYYLIGEKIERNSK